MAEVLECQGIKELLEQLKGLPIKMEKQFLRKALSASTKPIKAEMVSRAPVLKKPKGGKDPRVPGQLRKAIRIRSRSQAKKGLVSSMVTIGAKWFVGKQFWASFVVFGHRMGKRPDVVKRAQMLISKMKKRGLTAQAEKLREHLEAADSRKKVEPNTFMQDAFQSKRAAALSAFAGKLNEQLSQLSKG